METPGTPRRAELRALALRVLVGVGAALLVLAPLLLFWWAIQGVLLLFAGVLLAVFLRTPADWLARRTPLPPAAVLALVCLLLVGAAVGIGFAVAPRVSQEVSTLTEELPRAVEQVRGQLARTGWGRWLVDSARSAGDSLPARPALGILSSTVGAAGGALVVLFTALFLASAPSTYRRGLIRLLPPARRPGGRAVLREALSTLQWWLLGQLSTMAITGILTGLGLWALGLPLAFVLGLLAGLLAFVPNFGPVASALPGILLGFAQSPTMGLWVTLMYVGVQTVESYVITPLIQQRALDVPPALIIATQVVLGLTAGVLGVALATPLLALSLILVRRLYLEGVLGERPAEEEEREAAAAPRAAGPAPGLA